MSKNKSKVQVKVDTKVFDKLAKKIGKLANKTVRVGVLASKGGHEERDGITMIELAAIHELGSPAAGIPERSFIRSTLTKHPSRVKQTQVSAKLAKKIIAGKMNIDQALNVLGLWAATQVKKGITTEDIPPPLKQSTIDAKGSTKPLVDTGRLLNAIQHEVE